MVSQGTQKRSSRWKAKGQRSPLSTSGVLKQPQKMVHAVDQHQKEGQDRSPLGKSCEWAVGLCGRNFCESATGKRRAASAKYRCLGGNGKRRCGKLTSKLPGHRGRTVEHPRQVSACTSASNLSYNMSCIKKRHSSSHQAGVIEAGQLVEWALGRSATKAFQPAFCTCFYSKTDGPTASEIRRQVCTRTGA